MRTLGARRLAWGVLCVLAAALNPLQGQAASLRFFGNGIDDVDRVKIRLDDPTLPADVGPPVDVGDTDFTIELWVRGFLTENTAPSAQCGTTNSWIYGNIIIDRDRFNQGRNYGISFGGGVPMFGVMNESGQALTLCATSQVLDGAWHHLAFQRRIVDGTMEIFVDGVLEANAIGPGGDITYPDDGIPQNQCGGPCVNSDPFLVFAAEKHDAGSEFPSFSGWMDEVRVSNAVRYSTTFAPPVAPFAPDSATVGLYHFDEGAGTTLTDASGATGGPSDGVIQVGGSPVGPQWSSETPFLGTHVFPTPDSMSSLVISPNPARSYVEFRKTAPVDTEDTLVIFDVHGRLVARPLPAAGTWRWDTRGTVPGVYFGRLGTEPFSFVVVR